MIRQNATFSSAISTPTLRRVVLPITRRRLLRFFAPFITFTIILALWQLLAALNVYSRALLPTPVSVAETFYAVTFGDGRISLWHHVRVTLTAVLWGLVIGLSLAVVFGYWIAKIPLLEDLFSPLIVSFQATPVVAYAPLLVIWFGSGVMSKVITSALIVFFPTLMNTVVGVRSVPASLHSLMRAFNASPRQILFKLEIPAAAPVLLGGLKVSATLAVIGAVVGEFVSANAGLGFLVNLARSRYDTPLVIVAVMTLTLIALILYGLVALLERYALRWQRYARD